MSSYSFSNRYIAKTLFSLHKFHTCSSNYGQANVMKKLLKGSSKRKPIYSERPILPTPETFTKGALEGKKSQNSKRVSVLNKLFMRHITDLMTTGENAELYAGLGIEINKIQVMPDYKLIHVYWVAKGNETDEVINKLLTKNAGQLRHELTQLRVIGVVPKLLFCKDKSTAVLAEIDAKLSAADFGDDHVPVDLVSKLKAELELNTSLEPDIKEKLNKLEGEDFDDITEIPVMPQNVFGLNHSAIMSKVVRGIKKSKAIHRKEPSCDEDKLLLNHSININPIQFEGGISQKEAVKRFILQRQLERRRAVKANKNYSPDKEYMQKELEERFESIYSEPHQESIEEKDYIDEYDADKN